MGFRCFISLLVLSTSATLLADFRVETVGGPLQTIDGGGISVGVFPGATITTDDEVHKLRLTGAGVRETRKLGIFSSKEYAAVSYLDQPMDRANPMASVKASHGRVLQLTMSHHFSPKQLRALFEGALAANGVDLEEPALWKLLRQVDFDLLKGAILTIASWREEAGSTREHLILETSLHTVSASGPELGQNFWKIWFGKPVDNGMKKLQARLVGSRR